MVSYVLSCRFGWSREVSHLLVWTVILRFWRLVECGAGIVVVYVGVGWSSVSLLNISSGRLSRLNQVNFHVVSWRHYTSLVKKSGPIDTRRLLALLHLLVSGRAESWVESWVSDWVLAVA